MTSQAVLAVLVVMAIGMAGVARGEWKEPTVELKKPLKHPVVAATAEELERLRAAWKSTGPAHDVLAERFARANDAIKAGLSFPPEGGQHNQWYQCDKCQVALKTIDSHHHQCPKCGTIYSGFPYDNVLYSKQHSNNVHRAEDAAWAWAVTGDRKYAQFAADVLTGYAQRYLNYPMLVNSVNDKSVDVAAQKHGKYKSAGHIDNQTLGEAMLLIPLSKSYDLIYDAGVLSDEQKKQVEDKLLRAMADCIDVNRMGKSNWQTWHNAARMYAGAVLGDEAMVKQALFEPKNGFAFQMGACVSPEGMWFENSWGYHYYTLMALTDIAECGRRLGMDLYSQPRLKKMYFLALDYRMSDGTLPRFGDAVHDTTLRPSVNEFAYAAYKDDRLLPTLTLDPKLPPKPTFDSVMLGRDVSKAATAETSVGESMLFKGAGHAILRTNGPGNLSAAMTFSPYGGFHSHFDKLSFVFFGDGEELGVDPGRAASQAYRLPIHRDWYKATTGHNAVLVDGKGQKAADGKLISFTSNKDFAAVAADAGPAFDDVSHKRLLLLTPTYLLVVDELEAKDGKEHVFDWVYHNKGTGVKCEMSAGKGTLGDNPGYGYLKDVKAFDAKGDLTRLVIEGEKIDTHVTMEAAAGDEVFTATGPLKSVDDRVPVIVVRRKGKNVRFATVIEPVKKGEQSGVTGVKLDGHVSVTRAAPSGIEVDGYWTLFSENGVGVRQ
jgi:hypothetical protein